MTANERQAVLEAALGGRCARVRAMGYSPIALRVTLSRMAKIKRKKLRLSVDTLNSIR